MIIVIGSGIAGLVSAIEAYNSSLCETSVLILEKESKIGGNSLKATSGISICIHPNQLDSFINDTLTSGRGNPNLVHLLARKSMSVLSWLKQFDIDLPVVSQCGGHSICRTFTNEGNKCVGSYIVDKLLQYIQSKTNIQILTNTRVVDIDDSTITLDNGSTIPYNSLILATGGYSSNKNLLSSQHAKLPTTNGNFATGDGLYLGAKLGGQLVDMNKVQIHPTYFVKEPILAPEALRACGGILINKFGQRFIDELQPRDVIVSAWPKDVFVENNFYLKNPVWIVLNQEAITKFGQEKFDFYISKNIFKKIKPKGNLLDTVGGGSEPVWIAQVQPAVHYTMGGLKIDGRARVIGTQANVFAAGEVTGGIHGKNRLAGNSLLETIVFGRIAGRNAAKITT